MSPRRGAAAAAAAGALLLGALLLGALGWAGGWRALSPGAAQAAPPEAALPAQTLAAAPLQALGKPQPPEAEQPLPANSLAGTEADGDWALDASGQPQPSLRLRRRFDWWFSQIGERDLASLRAQLLAAVEPLPAPARQSLPRLWDAYVRLQGWPWQMAGDLRQPARLRAAVAERQAVRRQLLGPAWAEAFYGDEERQALALAARLEQGQPEPEPAGATPPLLPDAVQREHELAQAWQQWEARIAASRAVLQAIDASPSLSAPQAAAARQRHLLEAYAAGGERLRAAALLGLPTAGVGAAPP